MTALNGFPSQTTVGQGLFNGASSTGMIQGHAFQDPGIRNQLASGVVSQGETIPMWGGMPVYADVSPITSTGPKQSLGLVVGRATALTGATGVVGFSVFDQAYNMVNDPNNPVPTAGSGQSLNYYKLGSRARLAVPCSSTLVSLRGGNLTQQVSWDFADGILVPYAPGYSAVTITGAVWANTNGGQITFTVGTDLTTVLSAGDVIDTAGIVQTGGTGGSYNGQWIVVSVTSTTVVVIAAAGTGFYPTYTSGGTILAAGGALPVTVLDVQPTGCMTVVTTGGLYTWNYNGACALIQLTGGTTA